MWVKVCSARLMRPTYNTSSDLGCVACPRFVSTLSANDPGFGRTTNYRASRTGPETASEQHERKRRSTSHHAAGTSSSPPSDTTGLTRRCWSAPVRQGGRKASEGIRRGCLQARRTRASGRPTGCQRSNRVAVPRCGIERRFGGGNGGSPRSEPPVEQAGRRCTSIRRRLAVMTS